MKYLSKIEFKIFFTFFIIYLLFAHWVGWNEQSRLLQTIAIVDREKLDITEYANFTGDRSYFNGKYYSDKAPGVSFLLSPIYLLSKIVTNDKYSPSLENKIVIPDRQFNTTVYTDLSEGNAVHLTRILGIIFLSSLTGALIIVLIYKILFENLNDRKIATIVSFIFGVGTLLFSYSSTLFGNIFSLFLVLLSFYLILFKQGTTNLEFLVGGILLGISVIFDYLTVFISLISLVVLSFLYVILREKFKSYKIILIGFIFGMVILPIYNYVAFGNVLTFSWYYIDPDIFPCKYGQTYLESCQQKFEPSVFQMQVFQPQQLNQIAILLFSAYKGLFFYSPFLLFSFLGFRYLFKKNWLLSVWVLFIFFSYLTFNSIYSWFGGSSFGSRYLIYTLPFLTIPTAYFIKYNKNNFLRYAFLVSVIIAIFHIILGNSGNWEGLDFEYFPNEIKVRIEWYKNTFYLKSFWRLNPLYQHYLPAFLDNGPRSRILEFLLIGKTPDIRDFIQMPYREIKILTSPFGFVVFKVPFLSFILFVFVFTFIWRKELSQYKIIGISLKHLIIIILFLLFLSRIEFKYITFGKGWMPQGINETVRWSSKSGEIYIFSPIERDVILNISLLNYRGKTLEFYINDNLINTYISPESILEIVKLKKGENKLLLLSKEDCEIPLYVENQLKCSSIVECMKLNITIFNISFDARCLSFGVANISIVPLETFLTQNISIAYGSGFYPQEKYGRWMSTNSVLYIYSPQTRIVFLNISLDGYQNVSLSAFLNNKFIGSFHAQTFFERVILKEGINELRFISDSCIVPAYVLNGSNDYRCLTKVIRNITIVDEDDLKPGVYFGSNWYDDYWMPRNASFYIYSYKDENVFLNVLLSTYKNITFVFLLNNKTIGEFQGYRVFESVALNKGLNKLTIISNHCYIPAFEEKNSSDLRCLSLAVKNISLIDVAKLRKPEVYFGSGWYDEEKYTGRWASKKSTLYIYSDEEKTVFFNISVPYYKAEDIKIILNNQSLGDFKVQSLFVPLTLKKGLNKLELYPDKCEIPAYIENNSKDFRCLSFFVRNISLINLDELKEKIYFGSGWYEKEENGRWTSSSSIIYLVKQLNYSKLSLEVESFRQPRKLFIEIDGRSYVFDIPVQRTQKISLILTPTNVTQIKLKTYPACEVPDKNDNRCLSLFLRNFSLENLNNIEYFDFFDEEKYNEIKFRWFSTDSKVYLLSNETNLFLIKFNVWTPPAQKRILKIYINGMKISEYNINETMTSINLPVILRKGINEIVFLVDACGYVAKDTRCLGAAISEIQKEDINIQNIEKIAGGFYGLETAYGNYFRWLGGEGKIHLFSPQNNSIKLYARIGWTYFSDRNLNITLNNKLIFAEKIAKNGKDFSISLDLVEGWNSLNFASTCDIPARLEFSEDKRCLSLAFMNLSFLAFGS